MLHRVVFLLDQRVAVLPDFYQTGLRMCENVISGVSRVTAH